MLQNYYYFLNKQYFYNKFKLNNYSPMKLGEILLKLAEKSGTEINSESFQNLLKSVETVEVDETLAPSFDNLMSLKQARNNSEVKNHYFSQFADGLDAVTKESFKAFGITEEKFNELKATEPQSFKRIGLLTKEAKTLIDSINGAKDGSKKEAELIAQYEQKMKEIQAEKESFANANKELVQQHQNERLDWITTDYIRKNPLNTEIPFIDSISKMALNEYLNKVGAKPVLVNGKIELRQTVDESLSFEGRYEDVVSKALAENKLLKVSQQATPPTTQQTQTAQVKTNSWADTLKSQLNQTV